MGWWLHRAATSLHLSRILGNLKRVLLIHPATSFGLLQKYNMFMAQVGCAAIGVMAFSIFGPGWLARSAALAASIAFMIYTRYTHPLGSTHRLISPRTSTLNSNMTIH
ncbi:hypothetical protein CRYUN_Cryun07bG0050400 [Craigia yunnanensis]